MDDLERRLAEAEQTTADLLDWMVQQAPYTLWDLWNAEFERGNSIRMTDEEIARSQSVMEAIKQAFWRAEHPGEPFEDEWELFAIAQREADTLIARFPNRDLNSLAKELADNLDAYPGGVRTAALIATALRHLAPEAPPADV